MNHSETPRDPEHEPYSDGQLVRQAVLDLFERTGVEFSDDYRRFHYSNPVQKAAAKLAHVKQAGGWFATENSDILWVRAGIRSSKDAPEVLIRQFRADKGYNLFERETVRVKPRQGSPTVATEWDEKEFKKANFKSSMIPFGLGRLPDRQRADLSHQDSHELELSLRNAELIRLENKSDFIALSNGVSESQERLGLDH